MSDDRVLMCGWMSSLRMMFWFAPVQVITMSTVAISLPTFSSGMETAFMSSARPFDRARDRLAIRMSATPARMSDDAVMRPVSPAPTSRADLPVRLPISRSRSFTPKDGTETWDHPMPESLRALRPVRNATWNMRERTGSAGLSTFASAWNERETCPATWWSPWTRESSPVTTLKRWCTASYPVLA